jgi:hypothetical protein
MGDKLPRNRDRKPFHFLSNRLCSCDWPVFYLLEDVLFCLRANSDSVQPSAEAEQDIKAPKFGPSSFDASHTGNLTKNRCAILLE